MKLPKLHYFDRSEFIRGGTNWFYAMSPRLLILLDTFRYLTGKCIISPHEDAIGRETEIIDGYYDAHNFNKWQEVRAVDVFPTLEPKGFIDNFPLVDEQNEYVLWAVVDEWINVAKMLNFGGIGVYPHWKLHGKERPGLHLDVREKGNNATWGRVNRNYVSLDKAIEVLA